MITIARFFNVQSADLARMALDASGIPVFLLSEGHAQLTGPIAVGGIRIQVPGPYAADARKVLESLAEEQGGELF